MSEINGLPELPETDLFFRVGTYGVELLRRLGDRISTHHPMKHVPASVKLAQGHGVVVERVVAEAKRLLWWESSPRVVEYFTTGRHELVALAKTEPTGETGKGCNEWGQIDEVPVRAKITREDVPRLAQIALDKYNEMKDRESLVGDYPPKIWETK